MNSNLAPTTVVDKNGRTTTVHKRTAINGSSAAKRLPSPTAAPKAATRVLTKTPLVEPAPLTVDQQAEFSDWYLSMSKLKASFANSVEIDDDIQAMAWHVTREGQANHHAVVSMLDDYVKTTVLYDKMPAMVKLHANKTTNPASKLKAHLRVVERIGAGTNVDLSLNLLRNVMEAYGCRPKQQDCVQVSSIETEEDLAALTAITLFIQNAADNDLHDQTRHADFTDSEGTVVYGARMINRSLDAYLRENPSEVHQIIDYVNAHKPGTTIKDTKEILQQVAEIKKHGALGKGWL